MKSLLVLPGLALLLLSFPASAQQKCEAKVDPELGGVKVCDVQKLQLENTSLKLAMLEQQARTAAAPLLRTKNDSIKEILEANPGYQYNPQQGVFFKPAAAAPKTPPPSGVLEGSGSKKSAPASEKK